MRNQRLPSRASKETEGKTHLGTGREGGKQTQREAGREGRKGGKKLSQWSLHDPLSTLPVSPSPSRGCSLLHPWLDRWLLLRTPQTSEPPTATHQLGCSDLSPDLAVSSSRAGAPCCWSVSPAPNKQPHD